MRVMPASNWVRGIHNGLTQADSQIVTLFDAGLSAEQIRRKLSKSARQVSVAIQYTSESGSLRQVKDLRTGSQRLLETLTDQSSAPAPTCPPPERRLGASLAPGALQSRPRPVAFSREPCPRCGTRGDIGCAHQGPCAPLRDDFAPAPDLRSKISGGGRYAFHGHKAGSNG